jgi:MFS family permease
LAVVTDPVHEVLPDEPEPPRSWRVDTTPLRESRDFRIIWTSGLVTYFGSITTYVALPFQIKELTGSLALAGLLSAVEIVPLVLFGLLGGAIADAFDRRRTVLALRAADAVHVGGLLANALLDEPRVWPLFVIAGLFATADALQRRRWTR